MRAFIRTADSIADPATRRLGLETAEEQHPDVEEARRLFGVSHTHGGRRLHDHHTAATRQVQEQRLADPQGWRLRDVVRPLPDVVNGARGYSSRMNLPDPHGGAIDFSQIARTPSSIRRVGRAYDGLPLFDRGAVGSFRAMRGEVNNQFDHAVNRMNIRPEFVDQDPYDNVHQLMNDVRNNKRLKVLSTAATGGHPFFNDETNNKFRFVHDLFGHAGTGRGFDRHGEHAALLAHSRMFSPAARAALASETLGQNSSLILNGEFGPQRIALLPSRMYSDNGLAHSARNSNARTAAPRRLKLPHERSNKLDEFGFSQRKLNGNFLSWLSETSPEERAEGELWYPVGHDWGHHIAARHGVHPDKVFGVLSKTSPQRDWPGNIRDAHNIVANYHRSPGLIRKPPGVSGGLNLDQALRVMGAPDDPAGIHAAFMGGKSPREAPKTLDFYRTLRDPEEGGAHRYMDQPGVVDSWMARSMLWSKKRWQDAKNGGRPLSWPGKGTGQGLDAPRPKKELDPETGKYRVVGMTPPSARDVAVRVVAYGGAYNRMRNAMRYGAQAMDMPFTHGAQATVWKAIGGTPTPAAAPNHHLDLDDIDDPNTLYNEMWARHAHGGLLVPARSAMRRRIAGSPTHESEEDAYDYDGEDWATPENLRALRGHLRRHILRGEDPWESGRIRRRRPSQEAPPRRRGDRSRGQVAKSVRFLILPKSDPQAAVDAIKMHAGAMASPEHFAMRRIALPKITPELLDAARADGFTVHDHLGDAPTKGYMVSFNDNPEDYHSEHNVIPVDRLHAGHVQSFVDKNANKLSRPDVYLGGWLHNGHVYLDVSRHHSDLYNAARMGQQEKQIGIYDLANGRTIPTEDAGWMTGLPGVTGGRHVE